MPRGNCSPSSPAGAMRSTQGLCKYYVELNIAADTDAAFRIQSRISSVAQCDAWLVVKQTSYRCEAVERVCVSDLIHVSHQIPPLGFNGTVMAIGAVHRYIVYLT